MGVSMGGNGALTLGFVRPDRFAAVVSFSAPASPLRPGLETDDSAAAEVATLEEWERIRGRPLNTAWRLRWGRDPSQWWQQDPARAARRLLATGLLAPALRLDVGHADPYLQANRALHRALDSAGMVHQYFETPGVHEWPHWRRRAPLALRWLAEQLSP
jgi:S-formylglutathione hydrolase FrmB